MACVLTPEEIRRLRRAADLTQEELADRVGVARQTVIAWEQGVHEPSPDRMELLVEELAQAGGAT